MNNIKLLIYTSGICLIILFFSLWRINVEKYENEHKQNIQLKNELSAQITYIVKKDKEHKQIIDKYSQIIENLNSDECGKSEIPEYLKIAIRDILDE